MDSRQSEMTDSHACSLRRAKARLLYNVGLKGSSVMLIERD